MELSGRDSPMEKYLIHTIGHYIDALVSGKIEPLEFQHSIIQGCLGKKPPGSDVETAWVKFIQDYPDRDSLK